MGTNPTQTGTEATHKATLHKVELGAIHSSIPETRSRPDAVATTAKIYNLFPRHDMTATWARKRKLEN